MESSSDITNEEPSDLASSQQTGVPTSKTVPTEAVTTIPTKAVSTSKSAESVPRATPGPKGKYPWSKWANGELHTAIRDVDFTTPIEVFRITVTNTARRKGMWATTSVEGPGVLTFQFFKTERERDDARRGADDYDDGYGDSWPED